METMAKFMTNKDILKLIETCPCVSSTQEYGAGWKDAIDFVRNRFKTKIKEEEKIRSDERRKMRARTTKGALLYREEKFQS
jgi:hypothetical protein